MLNNLNNKENIITKSQIFNKLQLGKVICDSFAKTINYFGIHSNFNLDIPEIIEEEKRQQERRDDVKRFTKLAVSNPENLSHNRLVQDLLSDETVLDEYQDQILATLSTDEQLLKDLGL